jgi:eukaryotic-like serine/threonine-protein kinase
MNSFSAQETSPRDTRERELFIRILEIEPGARGAWLAAECRGDAALRERIEELLREEELVGTFLETPAMGARGGAVAGAEKPGDRIGPYKLLQQIGEGGCGVVYMAEQERPVRRRVALKVIKLGMDTRSVIARFEAERQALALMDHPNIAKVLEAGATESGRPYFVMELVRGIRITDYCDQNQLGAVERLELFITLCHAIQHAHQKGIIHRDIKPSNVLVTLHDGKPVPKVIDFGIAKATEQRLTEKTLFTEFQAFIGTPAYMSPEQAEMSGLDIDTRGDIYSLGVLLYQLLTGQTPFDGATLLNAGIDECRRTIREEEPPRPSNRVSTLMESDRASTAKQRRTEPGKLVQLLRGDLDWVVMKCLEKDRTRRYASAHELASDVLRYLENEPVAARPPSAIYRLQKMVRRNRGAVTAGLVITLILLLGTILSTTLAIRAKRAEIQATLAQRLEAGLRRQAERERAAARINLYVADMNLAHQSFLAGNLGRAAQLVEKHRPEEGEPDRRGFEWRYLWQLCQGNPHESFPYQDGPVNAVRFSPGGNWVAVAVRDKITIWNVATRSLIATLPQVARSLAFLPDERTLVTSSRSGLRVWSTEDWTERAHFKEEGGMMMAVSRDGSLVASAGWDFVRIRDGRTWEEVRRIPGVSGRIAFSRDGKKLFGDSREGMHLWDVASGARGVMLQDSAGMPPGPGMGPFLGGQHVEFSPDGKWIAVTDPRVTAQGDFRVRIWDTASGLELRSIPSDPDALGHGAAITSLDVSPDGKTLVTGSWDHSVRLWDVESGRELAQLQGHSSEVWAVNFSPDGQRIITGSKEGGLKMWPVRQEKVELGLDEGGMPLGISKDSRILAAMNWQQGVVNFFDLATREPEEPIRLEMPRRPRFGFAFGISADLRTIAHAMDNGVVRLVHAPTHETSTLSTGEDRVDWLTLSADGRMMITGRRDRFPRLWDLRRNSHEILPVEAYRALISPDQQNAVTFSREEGIQIWDVKTQTVRFSLTALDQHPADLAESFSAIFSPDGKMLAVGSSDNAVRLWNVETGEVLAVCSGHMQGVFSLAFAPDGKSLATSSYDGTVKFWSLETYQELLTLRGNAGPLFFSPDGGRLVSGSGFFGPNAGKLVFYVAPGFEKTDGARKGY